MAAAGITRVCQNCRTLNRVPPRFLASMGKCGSCQASLPPASEPIEVDTALFDEVVRSSRVPVLVDFWAAWCGPCRAAAPELAALAKEMTGKALVLKVNTEEQTELATRYRVQSIPNFVVFQEGKVVLQQPGLVPKQVMRGWLASAAQTASA